MSTSVQSALHRIWSWSPTALATALIVLICLKAVLAVDLVWDSLSYHLPFTALRVGLMTEWQFQRPPPAQDTLTGYYLGFPILGDLLRGWLWKLSGRVEAVNLLGIISIFALLAYLKWSFRQLEIAWVAIGILAVPAVQTAAAGNYLDLPANAAYTIMLFSIVNLWTDPERFRRPAPWLILFLAAFAAANIKFQTSIFVCLALPFVLPPIVRLLRERGAKWKTFAGAALLWTCASLLIAVNLIKNLILYGNPIFPIDMKIAGIHFVGTLIPDNWLTMSGPYAKLPDAVHWLGSIIEYRALDGRGIPYMNGMGDVPDGWSSYAGGFFSALVVASVCFLLLSVRLRRDRASIVAALALALSSIMLAFFPNSYNLRYETYWMMFLITSCLLLLARPSLRPYLRCYKIVLISSLAFVTSVTGGVYFIPQWNPMQEYVDRSGTEKLLEAVVEPGDVICLRQGAGEWDNRFAIMFAPIFHQKLAKTRPYAIKEGFCDGYKTIPRGNN